MKIRASWKASFFVLICLVVMPVPGHAQKLLAEIQRSITIPGSPSPLVFCVGYGPGSFTVPLNPVIGCDVPFPPSTDVTYFDYNATNSPLFTALTGLLTNDVPDATLWFCSTTTTILAVCSNLDEPTELAGSGTTIDFIRLVVYRVFPSDFLQVQGDVAWQFWNGAPQFSGGGQRSDVNDFLRYSNPLEPTSTLATGVTGFALTITYGPTIAPGTFKAVVNGEPFLGFTPSPGITETVVVPVSQGRNVVVLSVDGAKSNGAMATDRDRLTFIVP